MIADIRCGRLDADEIRQNFSELHPPLTELQAIQESARCLFCHDAPCVEACPTDIDIPGFIRKIASGNVNGAAKTILNENIMGTLISSLHRYLNMHVKNGVKESNISLAFVLHGASTKDALTNEAYKKKYGIENPNIDLIKTLSEHGVDMYICGQSAAYEGISKSELLPEIKLALSAMSVLTIYQSEGYSLIKF